MSDLLPPNALPPERAMALATARVGDVPVPISTLHDPATCPAALLPWLAWAESVDEWDSGWTEAQKRSVIAAARAVHERKGTAGALSLAMQALDLDLTVTEWFQQDPPGDPYTFIATIIVEQEPIATEAAFARIVVGCAALSVQAASRLLTAIKSTRGRGVGLFLLRGDG